MTIAQTVGTAMLTDFQHKVLEALDTILAERNLKGRATKIEQRTKGSWWGDCYVKVDIPEKNISVWAYGNEIGLTFGDQFSLLERTRDQTDETMIQTYLADLKARL